MPIVVFPAHGKWIPEVCLDSYIEGSGYTNWIVDEYGGSGVKIKDSRGTE